MDYWDHDEFEEGWDSHPRKASRKWFSSSSSRFSRKGVWVPLFVLLVGLLSLPSFAFFYTDWLWFDSLGFSKVFWIRFWSECALFVGTGLITFFTLAFVWMHSFRISIETGSSRVLPFSPRVAGLFILGIAALFGVLLGSDLKDAWETVLLFWNATPFGSKDPLFGHDVGFYVFQVPFFKFIQGWLFHVFLMAFLGALVIYLSLGKIPWGLGEEGGSLPVPGQRQLVILAALLSVFWGVGYWLDRFDLLFSRRGVIFGAGFTAIHVDLLALNILTALAFVLAVILLLNLVHPAWRLTLTSVGILFVLVFLLRGFAPGLVQQYIVKPNEYDREVPYIQRHIEATLKAYGLDSVTNLKITPENEVTWEGLSQDKETVQNIRLWDYGPLLRTYKQLQEIRSYYDFPGVDIDRYQINGHQRQVMLSVRELDPGQLQNPTWVNTHLEFTHGYGVVMNPVNEVDEDGLPVLYMKDLPPKISVPIPLTKPQVYYGEKESSYVLVKTDTREFDYPMGDSNVRTVYEGKGGVPIHSLLRRLAFALRFHDTEILFTGSLKPESRILYVRSIRENLRKIAPFLLYDDDPYPVLIEGRVIWLQDAYTATDRYPYSEPLVSGNANLANYNGLNYIRNSVKASVDAYDGTIHFYVVNPADPLIRSWSAIFPGLFSPQSAMPKEMLSHLRYPEGLFSVQSEILRVYHMTDPNTFYNKEDVWSLAQTGGDEPVRPNYVTLRLIGEREPEFALIIPFMPVGRNNMIGWMAGRCDPAHYGKLVLYEFPKQKLIYGPPQINALIDQNPEISAQLSLWSQRGSDVIRGDLLVIPVGKSILYVQPLYLKAEKGELPELKRVIVSTGGRVTWAETLSAALQKLLGGNGQLPSVESQPVAPETPLSTPGGTSKTEKIAELAQRAQALFEAATKAQREGDWSTYGEELRKLKETLSELLNATR